MLKRDRWLLLLKGFAVAKKTRHLASTAEVSMNVLKPSYLPSERVVEKVALAAAKLLTLDADQILVWLHGERSDDLQVQFEELTRATRRCEYCRPPRPVRKEEWDASAACCFDCAPRVRREKQNPKIVQFRQALLLILPALIEKDPVLGLALQEILADPTQALTGPAVERASAGKIRAAEFSKRLKAQTGLCKRAEEIDWPHLKAVARLVGVLALVLRLFSPTPVQASVKPISELMRFNRRRSKKRDTRATLTEGRRVPRPQGVTYEV